jgi:hypothetical protein
LDQGHHPEDSFADLCARSDLQQYIVEGDASGEATKAELTALRAVAEAAKIIVRGCKYDPEHIPFCRVCHEADLCVALARYAAVKG